MHPGAVVADRWEIVAPLGAGGVGDVYRVRHRVSQTEAALKVVRTRGAYTSEEAMRFKREAAAPAQIGHPGIAAVLDAGVDPASGKLYIVTELLRGHTLRAYMKQGALPLILQVLEPLSAAHGAGFVHRDLKPENIFVDESRGVMLIDFGLARSGESSGATNTGQMMGTPHYMAPEQAMSARDATAAADVWAIGVMMYEAVAGRRPFEGQSLHALALAIQTQHHTPLSLAAPSTPSKLAALVDRCLDKHPEGRPANAIAMRRALDGLHLGAALPSGPRVSTGPIEAGRVDVTGPTMNATPSPVAASSRSIPATFISTAGAAPRPRRRSRLGCALAAAAVVSLLAVVAAASLWFVFGRTETVSGVGWSVEVPSDWEPIATTSPTMLASQREPEVDGVRATMSVQRMPWARGDLGGYVQLAVQSTVDNGGLIEQNRDATLDGIDGREIEFSFREYGGGSYIQSQRVVMVNGIAWVITCSGPMSRFESVRPVCHAIYDSVEIGH